MRIGCYGPSQLVKMIEHWPNLRDPEFSLCGTSRYNSSTARGSIVHAVNACHGSRSGSLRVEKKRIKDATVFVDVEVICMQEDISY